MEQNYSLSKTKIIVGIICMLFIWALVTIPLIIATDPGKHRVDSYEMNDGWNVTINDKETKDVVLNEFTFPVTQEGDVVRLSYSIPDSVKVRNPYIAILTVHCAFEMFLDGEEFYEYGMDRREEHLMIGYGRSRIALPSEYAGKELTIVLYVTEDAAFDGFQKFEIVDGSTYFKQEYIEGRTAMFLSIFLIGFGIVGMLFTIFSFPHNVEMLQVFCVAMFAALAGIWTLCNAGLMELLVPEIYVKSLFEYVTLYSAPIPLTFYFYWRIKEPQCPKFLRIWFWVMMAIEVGFVAITSALHKFDIIHLPKVLPICHVIFFVALFFVLTLAIVYIRKTKKVKRSVAIGLTLACVIAFFEIIYFNVGKYFIGFKNNKYNGTISVLAMIIVVTLFFDFVERMHTAVVEVAQKRLLENLAYMDELTALANRRKMDDTLVEYKEKNKAYAVVSLDMNYLKTLNDTYGHEMGDRALQFFAGCLIDVFDEDALIGRMGGDEFAIIIEDTTPDKLEKSIEELNHKLGDDIFPDTSIHLTCASGYAFSYECENIDDAYEIYRKSDVRMYNNKRMMKMKDKSS